MFPSLVAAVVATVLVGIPVGAAASRLRGPYLAGATLAFAVGLPALADKFPTFLGGENGLSVNPPIPPSWLGANFPLERWEAWIACAGALVVLFVLYNLTHSAIGRSWRAVRDDEIAASLAGLRVGRRQTLAFIVSAACAGLGGGLLAVVLQLTIAGRVPAAAVADAARRRRHRRARARWSARSGGRRCSCCSRTGPTTSRARSRCRRTSPTTCRSRSTALVLIGAMLVWPSGIQGGLRAVGRAVRPALSSRGGRPGAEPATDEAAAKDEGVTASQP